jgi:hypothetical protein
MKTPQPLLRISCLLVTLAILGQTFAPAQPAKKGGFGQPHIGAVNGAVPVLGDVKVVHFGKQVFKGKIDVNPTLKRIRDGKKLGHANDGTFFMNREGRLPRQADREYYREFVHEMKGLPFPGPQRVVIGKKGEVFYTGDHYSTFTRVR